MSPGWQQVDLASRCIKKALIAEDFQKMNSVVAVLQSVLNTMTQLLSARSTGSTSGGANVAATAESAQPDGPSADADAQPAADEAADES